MIMDTGSLRAKATFPLAALISALFFFAAIYTAGALSGRSVFSFLTSFYPVVNYNFVQVSSAKGLPANIFVYAAFFLSVAALMGISALLRTKTSLSRIAAACAIAFLALMCLPQVFSLSRQLSANSKIFSGKTTAEKRMVIFGVSEKFAALCEKAAGGKKKAVFMTDIDTKTGSGLMTKERLTYLMYPLDIGGIREGAPDCLIFFLKDPNDIPQQLKDSFPFLVPMGKTSGVALKKDRK
jgi:hypothetical protein